MPVATIMARMFLELVSSYITLSFVVCSSSVSETSLFPLAVDGSEKWATVVRQ
jgi:hypothetical protein